VTNITLERIIINTLHIDTESVQILENLHPQLRYFKNHPHLL
jgi:hypothetical protein